LISLSLAVAATENSDPNAMTLPPTEGPTTLDASLVIALKRNELWMVPVILGDIVKSASQSFFIHLHFVLASGVVNFDPMEDLQGDDYEPDLSRFNVEIIDGPNGETLLVIKQQLPAALWHAKVIASSYPPGFGASNENHTRAMLALKNNVANRQYKSDNEPLFGVCQFVLPFKVLKDVKEEDHHCACDDDGATTVSYRLWHAEQSGRTSSEIKKVYRVRKRAIDF